MVILACSLIDFSITKILVDVYGFAAEANPLLIYLMELTNSVYAILWFKIFTLICLTVAFWYIGYTKKENNTRIVILLSIVAILQFLVVIYGMWLLI